MCSSQSSTQIIAILRDPASRSRSRYLEQKFLQENVWKKQIKKRGLSSLEGIAKKDGPLIQKCLLEAKNPKRDEPSSAVAAIKCIRHFSVVRGKKGEGKRMKARIDTHIYKQTNMRI